MQALIIACFLAFFYSATAHEPIKQGSAANHLAYESVRRPYNYGQYGGGSYDYNNAYRGGYDVVNTAYGGHYPASYDSGAQYLQLSGGIYRPHDYDYTYGTGYRPSYTYDNTYKYYDGSASKYAAYPQAHIEVPFTQ